MVTIACDRVGRRVAGREAPGSIVKLYVLDAVAAAVERGELAWGSP